MFDLEDQVRGMLQRRAADVPPRRAAPPGLVRRAGRRAIATITGAVVVVAFLAVGAAAGVRILNQPNRVGSAAQPDACRAASLIGLLRLDGAKGQQGQQVGSFELTNVSNQTCWLKDRPAVMVVGPGGGTFGISEQPTEPWWAITSKPAPKGWPVVTLRPAATARLHVIWTSWCGSFQPAAWRLWIRDGGTLDVANPDGPLPVCFGDGESKVQVGPFEPVT